MSYSPGVGPGLAGNGGDPNRGGLGYCGPNPAQKTALGTTGETALGFTGGFPAPYQAVQSARHSLKLVGSAGVHFFTQKDEIFAPPELFFEQRLANPGTSTLSNADSRFANWNANTIHS